MEKTSRDMAQSLLIKDLVEIGFENPELGSEIYQTAKKLNKPSLLLSCRWIFGGVGERNFALIHKDVLQDIKAVNPELRISALTAIKLSFAKGTIPSWVSEIFSLLDSKQDDPDQKVKTELLRTYLAFYSYAKDRCFSAILDLSKKDNELMDDASNLLFNKDLTTQHYLIMVEFLAGSKEKRILETILLSFHNWAKKELIEPELKIVYGMFQRFSFFDLGTLNEALNEMGNADLETCLKYVYCWSQDEDAKIRYFAPNIAVEFARNDFGKLVDSINFSSNSEKDWFIFETSRILLEQIYERSSEGKNLTESDQRTINNLLEKLKGLAKTKGLNSEEIANKEQLTFYKCLILIEVMKNACANIDYNLVSHNLELFPNIRRFLGDKWLKKMEQEQNKTHPLLAFLNDKMLDPQELQHKVVEAETLQGTSKRLAYLRIKHSLRTRALLIHLENELSIIKDSPCLKNMKAALRKEEHFWKVFSEIDVMSRLIRCFSLEISPPLEIQDGQITKVKHPDFGLTFNGNKLYVEVIAPEMFSALRYFQSAGLPDNRVRAKITEELKSHFRGMKTTGDVIIIVDLASTELHYENIQDYVEGDMQFIFRMNAQTREEGGIYTQRGEPMINKDEETKIVVGIIGFTRVIGTDGRVHLKGRKFLNPQSSQKSRLLDSVTKALLG